MWHGDKNNSTKCNKYNWTIIYMYRASHVIYIITISTVWCFKQSLPVSHTTGSSYRSPHSKRTHLNMAYRYHDLNEWPNNRRSWRHYCLYYFIMLIENSIVKELESGGCIQRKVSNAFIFLVSFLYQNHFSIIFHIAFSSITLVFFSFSLTKKNG